MTAEVISLFTKQTITQQDCPEQELLDYLLWTMKFSDDPHASFDDPVQVFRDNEKPLTKFA